jgi:diguanylate cyclase (GGDEF)-like protein
MKRVLPTYSAPRRRYIRERPVLPVLVLLAAAVLALVLLAGQAAQDARKAALAGLEAWAADRELVELRFAVVESESTGDRQRAVRAFDALRGHLARDTNALRVAERLAPLAASPPVHSADTSTALVELRGLLADATATAETAARRASDRAHDFVIAASVLLVLLTGGVVWFALSERYRRIQLARTLEREANHDPLTRLPNRRFFLEWLSYALAGARREGTEIALLYIDLDGFKAVNDRHGHRRGDAVLAEIAERLRSTKREGDVLARLGGDEFALAATKARDGRELAVLGERILRTLSQCRVVDVPLGASIGIAFYPDDADDVPGLIAAADSAMYAAKHAGRNRIKFHGSLA